MKTKRIFYFGLIVLGALVMGYGDSFFEKEYAHSCGIVLLMLGIYKSTRIWSNHTPGSIDETKENTRL